jgi:hypothetical protein
MTEPQNIQRILLDMVDPLTTIRNAARAAEESLVDGAPATDLVEDIASIRTAAARLNALLKEARALKS